MQARIRRQGHIRRRGNSSWTVVVELGADPKTGKRRQLWRSVRGTKREAEAALVQLLHQRDTGIDAPPEKLTVGEYLKQWLDVYAEPNTAPKTFRRYEQYVRLHISPAVGRVALTKLRPLHIQALYSAMLQRRLSSRTVLHCHRVLREALQQALKWQMISRNPADAVEPPRPERYEIPAVPPAQVRLIIASAEETRYGALVHTAIMTGLRLGELLGLRWQDLDLHGSVLHVRQTCQWLSSQGYIFRSPKTYRSARPVSMTPLSVERLRQHRLEQLEERLASGGYEDNDLVFADSVGGPIYPGTLRDHWLRIVKKAGLGHLRFHDLRHVHASLLLIEGIHPKVVSERLGHSAVGITLDTYSHVLPSLQAEAVRKLDDLLSGTSR